jgi:hypothetical protein
LFRKSLHCVSPHEHSEGWNDRRGVYGSVAADTEVERQRRRSIEEAQTRMVLEIFEHATLVTLGLFKPKRISKKKQVQEVLKTLEPSLF